eukprot:scaffold17938_cov61-Phaeocystis_antarctica.AAC.5
MSVTLRVRPPRTASELEGIRSLKVKITKSACACEISALVTAAALMTQALVNGARRAAVGAKEEQHLKVALRHPGDLRLASAAAVGQCEARHGEATAILWLHQHRVKDETLGRRQPGGRRRGRGLHDGLLGGQLRSGRHGGWLHAGRGTARRETRHVFPAVVPSAGSSERGKFRAREGGFG